MVSATNAVVNIPAFTPGTFAPVVVTFTVINPNFPVDINLRAANQFHAIFIRAQCACTPTATVTEGDLFPGGPASFMVTTGTNSVTVDSIDSGTGLRSFTVVNQTNAVVTIPSFTLGTYAPVTATYTITNPALPVDITLRAANQFHAIFIRVRCGQSINSAAVSGRVLTPDGRGLSNAKVVMTAPDGSSRTVTTGSFGYYSFDDVEFGSNYVIGGISNNNTFASRILPVFDTLADVNFVAIE